MAPYPVPSSTLRPRQVHVSALPGGMLLLVACLTHLAGLVTACASAGSR